MAESSGERRCALAAALLPASCLLATTPFGAHPVDDDWQMYWSAFRFARLGEVRILDYSAMGMVGWSVPGGVVAACVGESFVALRLLSMACLVFTGWATFRLAREFGVRPIAALATSAVVSTSPVLFWLSTSFMTDAPWHALWVASLWLFARGLRTNATRDFALGAAAAVWAAWIRIPIAAAPIALVAAVFAARSASDARRRPALAAVAVLLLGVAGFFAWYRFVHGPTGAYRYKSAVDVAQMARTLPCGVFACAAYAGLFLLPLAPVALARFGAARRGAAVVAAAFAAVALLQAKTGLLAGIHKSMPYLPNVAFNLGLGPMTLTDVYREGAAPPVVLPAVVQVALGVACAALGGALLFLVARRVAEAVRSRDDAPVVFLAASVVLYLGSAVLFSKDSAPLFDRYLVPMTAPLAVLLVARRRGDEPSSPSTAVRAACGTLLAACAAFAVLGTRDYHRMTEARFDLADEALRLAGSPRRVDAGFEFDCWHNYEAAGRGEFTPAQGWKGWLVEDPQYVVAAHERPGYDVVDRRSLFSVVGLTRWNLLLLRRRG
jgi:4-amino-4-deoxy-L-arabinose transferase-like glycosyltransferase